MTFTSGLFLMAYEGWGSPASTPTWAECHTDLMGQAVVRLHQIKADGTGKETYGWSARQYLRTDKLSGDIQLLLDIDGEWSTAAWRLIEDPLLLDMLTEAEYAEVDHELILRLVLGDLGDAIEVQPLSDADVDAARRLDLFDDQSMDQILGQRGQWDPDCAMSRFETDPVDARSQAISELAF